MQTPATLFEDFDNTTHSEENTIMAQSKKNDSAPATTEEALPSIDGFDPHAVYSASEAAKVAGRTYNSVNNAKDKLAAAGATVEGTGKEWAIPFSALVKIGWLDENGNVIPPKRGRASGSTNAPRRSASKGNTEGLSLQDLKNAAEAAEAHANDLAEQARIARQEARAAHKALRDAVEGAAARAEELAEQARKAAEDAELARQFVDA